MGTNMYRLSLFIILHNRQINPNATNPRYELILIRNLATLIVDCKNKFH